MPPACMLKVCRIDLSAICRHRDVEAHEQPETTARQENYVVSDPAPYLVTGVGGGYSSVSRLVAELLLGQRRARAGDGAS